MPFNKDQYSTHAIYAKDSASIDAFGRWRVSDPNSTFDSTMEYNLAPLIWQTKTAGTASATHLPNEAACEMSIDTANNDSCIRQTYRYMRYQPGKSQLIFITFVFGELKTNVVRKAGYYDANNGIYFEQNGATGTGNAFVIRTKVSGSVMERKIYQPFWDDKMDGTGESGISLDLTKSAILVIDLEWLGVGRVRCGFNVHGRTIYCAEFNNANFFSTVYMGTANLPLRYEIYNSGTSATASTLKQICSSVQSEGGYTEERGYQFSASNGTTFRSVATRTPILSIRPKATFNSIVNRGQITIEGLEITALSNTVFWELVYNPTLTNASFNSVGTNSISEFDVAATALSGGITIASGYNVASATIKQNITEKITSRYPITLDIDGNNPIIVSLVAITTGGAATAAGSIDIKELY